MHPSGRGRGLVYELAFGRHGYDADSGRRWPRFGDVRAQFGGHSGDIRPGAAEDNARERHQDRASEADDAENSHLRDGNADRRTVREEA